MNTAPYPEIREVMNAIHYRPALSIILPLEAQVSLKTEAAHVLKVTADKAERALHEHYPDEQCEVVMQKLNTLIAGVDIPVKKKGIALFVSPLFQKIVYLDYPVTEKLIVDESFEVRDLLYSAKQNVQFILLILSGLETKVFLGNGTSLSPLFSNIPESVYAYVTDSPERVTNFTDMVEHKQIIVEKFLHHIDEELGNLINERRLPVLVLGAEKILGQFKKLSKYTASVMDYVEGNYENHTIAELSGLIEPYLSGWKTRRQQDLLSRLDEAAGQHRLTFGILQVWRDIFSGKGKLLMVEKNYRFIAQHGLEPGVIEPAKEPYEHLAYIPDAVDDAIERILQSGGDVEFTEDGVLEKYNKIALINYYE